MRRDTKIRKVFVPVLVINVCINQYCVILIVPPVFSIDVSIYIYINSPPKLASTKYKYPFIFHTLSKEFYSVFIFLKRSPEVLKCY